MKNVVLYFQEVLFNFMQRLAILKIKKTTWTLKLLIRKWKKEDFFQIYILILYTAKQNISAYKSSSDFKSTIYFPKLFESMLRIFDECVKLTKPSNHVIKEPWTSGDEIQLGQSWWTLVPEGKLVLCVQEVLTHFIL